MKNLRVLIILIVCACLCVGYYYYLTQRDNAKDAQPTKLEQVTGKDLDISYPTTPREVIKFYNSILLCLYNEECSKEELEALGNQARKLMDEELLEENPENLYLLSLETELEEYDLNQKKIIGVTLSNSKEVTFKEMGGLEYAYVEASYSIKAKKESLRAAQTYILRKDTEGKWKILGYYQP